MFELKSDLQTLPRRERHKEERRRAIEAAALGLFAEQGVDRTTIEEVTARADVAKGTFFNHYGSKHDVLASRLRRLARAFLEFIDEAPAGAEHPRARLVLFFRQAEGLFAAEGAALNCLYAEVVARAEFAAIDAEVEERVLSFYRDVLAQGVQTGLLRRGLDTELAARIIVDLWSSTLRLWMTGGCSSLAGSLEGKLAILFSGLERATPPAAQAQSGPPL